VPVFAGLCDRARGRPSRAESAGHSAEGATGATRRRQQGGGQPHPGAGGAAGRLPRRGVGEPRERNAQERRQAGIHRTGRRGGGGTLRGRDRRRYAAAAGAGLRGSRFFYSRELRAAPTVVQYRLPLGLGRKLQHLRRRAALDLLHYVSPRVMPGIDDSRQFIPLKIAVLTISDTRALADDKSGAPLVERGEKAGHIIAASAIVHRDVDEIPPQLQPST